MHIVVDENVPLAGEAFGGLGTVRLVPGRAIDARAVADADALVVRSVTRVDERLLGASTVRFVGTATIGTDHVDLKFLERRGIAFAHAPGSNARSVAEYVAAALLEIEAERTTGWTGATLGVVGVGNVGAKVVAVARALGFAVLPCDPPRAAAEGLAELVPLERVVDEADVVTLHVPLERGGRHPTWHLLDEAHLARLKPGAVVINTSRGGVVDDAALRAACASGRLAAVLDVWEDEPEPPAAVVDAARIATPHVAGYSLDGKLAGTRMVAEALHRLAGVEERPDPVLFSPPLPDPVIRLGGDGRDAVREAVRRAYAIREDDRRMRAALAGTAAEARRAAFDGLRRDYPVRREFPRHEVDGPRLGAEARAALAGLGFQVGLG